jgi:hypothetical protein
LLSVSLGVYSPKLKEDYMQANTHRKGKGYVKVHYISNRDSAHKLSLYRSAHQKLNKRPKI